MLRVKDKKLWGEFDSGFRKGIPLDISYVVAIASLIIALPVLLLTLFLSERLYQARNGGPGHAAAELLMRLESHKRACIESLGNVRSIMLNISIAVSSQDVNLRESEHLRELIGVREAVGREREELLQHFPSGRLSLLIDQISAKDPILAGRVARKVELLRMLEDSSFASLGSNAEDILLRADRAKSLMPRGMITRDLTSLVDRQQSLYSRMADEELGEIEGDLMPLVDRPY